MTTFTKGDASKGRYAQIDPSYDGEICYTIADNSLAFIALLARVKPGKFQLKEPRFGGCARLGASPFVISFRAFPGPHSKSVRGCALLPRRNGIGGWER